MDPKPMMGARSEQRAIAGAERTLTSASAPRASAWLRSGARPPSGARLLLGAMPRVRSALLVPGLVWLCLSANAASAETESPGSKGSLATNLEVLERLVRETVDESLERAPVGPDDVIHIRGMGGHRLGWIVENYLSARLAADVAGVYVIPAEWGASSAASGGGTGPRGRSGQKAAEWEGSDSKEPASPADLWGDGQSAGSTAWEAQSGDAGQDTSSGAIEPLEDRSPDSQAPAGQAQGETPVSHAGQDTTRGEGTPSQAGLEAPDIGEEVSKAAPEELRFVKEPPQTGKVLEFRVGELEVTYPRRWRGSLFGSVMVERSARAVVFFRLLDKLDGRVLWADTGRAAATDIVGQRALVDLEVDEEVGGPAGGVEAGGLGRVIEPVVVSGIVIGLVFLFYTSRT